MFIATRQKETPALVRGEPGFHRLIQRSVLAEGANLKNVPFHQAAKCNCSAIVRDKHEATATGSRKPRRRNGHPSSPPRLSTVERHPTREGQCDPSITVQCKHPILRVSLPYEQKPREGTNRSGQKLEIMLENHAGAIGRPARFGSTATPR